MKRLIKYVILLMFKYYLSLIYDIIVYRIRLVDVFFQYVYIAVFIISICFESSFCYDEKIFDNIIFLKELCDWIIGFKSEFMNNNCNVIFNVLYMFFQFIFVMKSLVQLDGML